MELILKRVAKKETYTIGHLYVNGEKFCDTIEDKDRGLRQDMPTHVLRQLKVYGETAIPRGTYRIDMDTVSPKYSQKQKWVDFCGAKMPRLVDVPAFAGILIHTGNTAADSYGCLIVGENNAVGKVLNSMETFKKLYKVLKEANDRKERINITIK